MPGRLLPGANGFLFLALGHLKSVFAVLFVFVEKRSSCSIDFPSGKRIDVDWFLEYSYCPALAIAFWGMS